MSDRKNKKISGQNLQDKKSPVSSSSTRTVNDIFFKSKNGDMMITIKAKPGSRENAITDISSEGIGVKIAAPDREGEANYELIKFLSSILRVKKSSITLDKGYKSCHKIICIDKSSGLTEKQLWVLLQDLIGG